MGDKSQDIYLKRLMPSAPGPILEVGSKNYGSTTSFREHFAGSHYVGIDMEAGEGVDAVVDLVEGVGGLGANSFALGICCSVMEHVRRPWIFAENLSKLIRPGGFLYISVPWVWRYHAYPDDYFRFSWRGVMELYPEFKWSNILYSTNVAGEFFPAEPGADDRGHILKDIGGGRRRKYLPYLCVNMLGEKIGGL